MVPASLPRTGSVCRSIPRFAKIMVYISFNFARSRSLGHVAQHGGQCREVGRLANPDKGVQQGPRVKSLSY